MPHGIYHDQLRFEMMLEDQQTVQKAMEKIHELAGKTDAESINQRTRWVTVKEAQATKTQEVIAQYFMTQRIKPPAEHSAPSDKADYVKKLTSAHAVLRAAMKCKQTVDAAAADALKKAITTFYEAYTGKPYVAEHAHD